MVGYVTSSYDSAALGRPFALALLRGRPRRVTATTIHAPLRDRVVAAQVTGTVLVRPGGRAP